MVTRASLARQLDEAEDILDASKGSQSVPKRIMAMSFLVIALVVSNLAAIVTWPLRAARRRRTSGVNGQITIIKNLEPEHLEGGRLILDVSADWCGPCLILDGVLEEFAARNPEVPILKLNATASSEEAARLRATGFPTLILFSEGSEVGRHAGSMSLERLEQLVKDCFNSESRTGV